MGGGFENPTETGSKTNQESLETMPQNVAKKSTLSTIWDRLTKGEGSYATYLSGWAGVTDKIRLS